MMEQPVARLAGEGVGKKETELPIDILASVLLEWLTSRKKLPADWSKRVAAIQAKAAECIKDVPASVLHKARGGADGPLDYFRAVDIRNELAAGGERTLFGGLTGNAAVWDKIVKAYEKGAVYLGEASVAMVHNADYEIPFLRKQAARLNQQITDAERKQAEYTRNAQTCAVAFQQECKKVGISGARSIRAELHALGAQVPGVCASVVEAASTPDIGDAMQHYRDFSRYAHATPDTAPLLPTLLEVRERRTSPPSTAAAAGAACVGGAGAPGAADQGTVGSGGAGTGAQEEVGVAWDIDAPGGPGAGNGNGGISWDIGVGDGGEAGLEGEDGGISWDVGVGEGEGLAEGQGGDGGGGISWDVGVGDGEVVAEGQGGDGGGGILWDVGVADAGASAEQWGIGVEDAGAEAGTSPGVDEQGHGTGVEAGAAGVPGEPAELPTQGQAWPHGAAAHRLACDGEYRMRLLDDLEELRAFLVQRRLDVKGSGSELLTAALPESIQAVDEGSLGRMLEAAEGAVKALKSERLRQLLMLATSPRFLERMTTALSRKAGQEAKLLAAAKDVEARRNEAKLQLMALAPKVAELVERTRLCKTTVEQGLSVMLGRRVNILGDLNVAISHTGL